MIQESWCGLSFDLVPEREKRGRHVYQVGSENREHTEQRVEDKGLIVAVVVMVPRIRLILPLPTLSIAQERGDSGSRLLSKPYTRVKSRVSPISTMIL